MKKRFFADLYINNRWYIMMITGIFLFITAFFISFIWYVALVYTLVLTLLTLIDLFLLFIGQSRVIANRFINERLNLGAENNVRIEFRNGFSFPVEIQMIEELPVQFQERNFRKVIKIAPGKKEVFNYELIPHTRGEYTFGNILCYVRSPLKFIQRRCISDVSQIVKVYPSTKYLRQFQLLALSDNSQFSGSRVVRKLGQSLEFEQIKEYVTGDDIRTINWKATARKGNLMVNHYVDARSQQIYCLIDKGRNMKMPFDGMTLLDYAINASLIFLNIALQKQDRAGLVTFAAKINDIIPAERNHTQISKLNEALYRQTTDFLDSSYEDLTINLFRKLSQRSFLLLFTNFETMASLERQLPYLKRMASRHLLCVVFFQNTLLKDIHEAHPDTMEGIYIKTIADRFNFEKKQIVKELRNNGIISILTTPKMLTVDVVNKYLELKARQMV
ncbi:DUF58 domain-containing protein [Taibaiella lutea]|uniref:DUF58 domain-containing protein n=1 Tax=Taibaiella lutea TaxID=2608001 RepID=A0A5M6CKH1_9BACT|nr:DUF58 domain-containing protein [Taibaiella lutea]KAA5534472.1 DUF58 domain-containing protein [Taibaiella lutea]